MKAALENALVVAEKQSDNLTVMVKRDHEALHNDEGEIVDMIQRYVEQDRIKHINVEAVPIKYKRRIFVNRNYKFAHKPKGVQLRWVEVYLHADLRTIYCYTNGRNRRINEVNYPVTTEGLAAMARHEILDLPRR